MSADLFVAVLVLGAIAALAALALDGLLRACRLPTRGLWLLALVAMPASGALAARRAAVRPVPVAATPAVGGARANVVALTIDESVGDVLRRTVVAPVDAVLAIARRAVPDALETPLAALWVAASLAALLAFALAYRRARREVHALGEIVVDGARVRLSPAVGPAVVGLARPEVVVPAWLLDAPAEARRLALAHEAEHVAARDPLALALGCLVAALVPWHPLAWWMLARLRLAVELDCDRRVLARGAARAAYGTLLIDVSGRGPAASFATAALAHGRTHLEARLIAMTASRSRRAILRAALPALLAPLAAIAACEGRLPTNAEVQDMDAAHAERRLVQLQGRTVLDSATYYLNDVLTTAEAVRAIPSERIASVSIRKEGRPAVAIVTKEYVLASDSGAVREMTLVASMRDRQAAPDTVRVTMRPTAPSRDRTPFTGIVLVDGRRADLAAVDRLAPDQIVSVDVIKGDRARAMLDDPAAANGIVRIVTKSAASASRP